MVCLKNSSTSSLPETCAYGCLTKYRMCSNINEPYRQLHKDCWDVSDFSPQETKSKQEKLNSITRAYNLFTFN